MLGANNNELVPKHMLDLCKDTLRRCLASRLELEERLRRQDTELCRLRRVIRQNEIEDDPLT